MGNNASSPVNDQEDWEGKFFTTSDGVKLSANVIKRLASDKEEENAKENAKIQENNDVLPQLTTSLPLYQEPQYLQELPQPLESSEDNRFVDVMEPIKAVDLHNVVADCNRCVKPNTSKLSDFNHQYDDSRSIIQNENRDPERYDFVCESDPNKPESIKCTIVDKGKNKTAADGTPIPSEDVCESSCNPDALKQKGDCNPEQTFSFISSFDLNDPDGKNKQVNQQPQQPVDEQIYDDQKDEWKDEWRDAINIASSALIKPTKPPPTFRDLAKDKAATMAPPMAMPDGSNDNNKHDHEVVEVVEPVVHHRNKSSCKGNDCIECDSDDEDSDNLNSPLFGPPLHSQQYPHQPRPQNNYPQGQWNGRDETKPSPCRPVDQLNGRDQSKQGRCPVNQPNGRDETYQTRYPQDQWVGPDQTKQGPCRPVDQVNGRDQSKQGRCLVNQPNGRDDTYQRYPHGQQPIGPNQTYQGPFRRPVDQLNGRDQTYQGRYPYNQQISPDQTKQGPFRHVDQVNGRDQTYQSRFPYNQRNGPCLPRPREPPQQSKKPRRRRSDMNQQDLDVNLSLRGLPRVSTKVDCDDNCISDEAVPLPDFSEANECSGDFSVSFSTPSQTPSPCKPRVPANTPKEEQPRMCSPHSSSSVDQPKPHLYTRPQLNDDDDEYVQDYKRRKQSGICMPRTPDLKPKSPEYYSQRVVKKCVPKEENFLPRKKDGKPVRILPDCEENCESDEIKLNLEQKPKPCPQRFPPPQQCVPLTPQKSPKDFKTSTFPFPKEQQYPFYNNQTNKYATDGRVYENPEYARAPKIYVVPDSPDSERNRRTFEEMTKPFNAYPVDNRIPPCGPNDNVTPTVLPTRPTSPPKCNKQPEIQRPEFLMPSRKPVEDMKGFNEKEIIKDFKPDSYPRVGGCKPNNNNTPTNSQAEWWDLEGQANNSSLDEEDSLSNYTPGYFDEGCMKDDYIFNNEDDLIGAIDPDDTDPCYLDGFIHPTAYFEKYESADFEFVPPSSGDTKPAVVNKEPVEVVQVVDLVETISALQVECSINLAGIESIPEVRQALEVEEGVSVNAMEGRDDDDEDYEEGYPYLSHRATDLADVFFKNNQGEDESHKFGGSIEIRKLDNISKVVYSEFESAANAVENKFKSPGFQSVCNVIQTHLLDCYKLNPGKPLACNNQLESLRQCVSTNKDKHIEKSTPNAYQRYKAKFRELWAKE